MLEKYGVAKLPPLRIAAETKPAIYIANYDLLVLTPLFGEIESTFRGGKGAMKAPCLAGGRRKPQGVLSRLDKLTFAGTSL